MGLLAYMNQSAVNMGGKGGGRMGGASCRLMRRAVRLARVATWGKASEHRGARYVGEHVVVRGLRGDGPSL